MKVTIMLIVIGAFGTITKGLLKRLEDLGVSGPSEDHPKDTIIENGQNTEKSPGDLRTCCHSNSSKGSSANADVKNSKGVNNNNRDTQNSQGFLDTNRSHNLGQNPRPSFNQ